VVFLEFALNAAPQGAEFGQILVREETCKSAAKKQVKHVQYKEKTDFNFQLQQGL